MLLKPETMNLDSVVSGNFVHEQMTTETDLKGAVKAASIHFRSDISPKATKATVQFYQYGESRGNYQEQR